MRGEVLLAIIAKTVEQYVAKSIEQSHGIRGPRGFQGPPGEDGKSFIWSDHEDAIRNLIRESALKFEDLSLEQIESLRGPRGRDGRDAEFVFDEHREKILSLVFEELQALKPDLKLQFSDLTEEEKQSLRGPRGQRGKPGKDFDFEEHREFFESLKPKFSEFTEEEKAQLKLKFSDLSPEEADSLKLKFSDLTEDDRILLRGPRGQRGRQGADGRDGERGPRGAIGPVGLTGPIGPQGPAGQDGKDGEDGKDAPEITDIEVSQYGNEVEFRFEFDNGKIVTTRRVELSRTVVNNLYTFSGQQATSAETAQRLVITRTAAEGISKFRLVTAFSSTEVRPAWRDDTYERASVLGMALNAANTGEEVSILVFGVVELTGGGFTINEPLFLGKYGVVSEIVSEDAVHSVRIGKAIGSNQIFLSIESPVILA